VRLASLVVAQQNVVAQYREMKAYQCPLTKCKKVIANAIQDDADGFHLGSIHTIMINVTITMHVLAPIMNDANIRCHSASV
jgi:hypothetical protein